MTGNQLRPIQRFPLTSYFLVAYAWTWLCWWSVVARTKGQFTLPIADDVLATLGQFGPFAAALLVAYASQGREGLRELAGRFFRWRANLTWLGVALFLLPATMLVAIYAYAYLFRRVDSLQFREHWSTVPAHFVYLLVLGGPLGEEPGWRGFALPRLEARHGPVVGSIWLGLLHAGWHLPLWWMRQPPCPFWIYVVGVLLVTFLFTWLFNHTNGSVLYSLIFHTSLSIASMRLPEAPAYHLWIVVLATVAVIVFAFDRRLGYAPTSEKTYISPASRAVLGPE
jgi:membrane protease YdiL (CAAX protease family)